MILYFLSIIFVGEAQTMQQKQHKMDISQKQYYELFENAPVGIICCDREGKIIYINQKTLEILGSNSMEETKKINLATFPLLVKYGFSAKLMDCMENNHSGMYEMDYVSIWGKKLWLRLHIKPLETKGAVTGAQIIIDDLTEQMQLKIEIKNQEERLRLMLKGTPSPALLLTKDFFILDRNKAAEQLFGEKAEDFVKTSTSGNEKILLSADKTANRADSINWESEYGRKIWSISWISLGEDIYLLYAVDITKYKEIEEKLIEISNTDTLTGLKNRHFFDELVKTEIERSNRYNTPLSLIMMDLDRFKRINDTYGHPTGDEVLKKTAATIQSMLRESDVAARVGGEEFMILLPRTDIKKACEIAEKMRKMIENKIHPVAGKVTASFGVAEKGADESADSIFRYVDEALYQAKERGRNGVVRYESTTTKNLPMASVHFEWSSDLESGDKILDEQHKALLDIANSLIFMAFSKIEIKETGTQIDNLIQHIIDHFEYEEQLQMDIGYPDYKQHVRIHKELGDKVLTIKNEYEDRTLKPSEVFSFILDEMVVGHILGEDVKFFPYIKK